MYISNLANKIKRNRSRIKLKSKKIRKTRDLSFLYKFVYILLGFALLGLLGYLIFTVYNFTLTRDVSDNREINSIQDASRISILLIGLDKTDKDTTFIDALSVLTYDTKSSKIGILGLNPDIEVYSSIYKKNIHLRSIYALPEAYGSEVPFTINTVESLLAIRIDRYLLMNTDGFQNIFKNFDPISVDVANEIKDDDLSKFDSMVHPISKGNSTVYQESFLSLVAADDNGVDEKLYMQSIFISSIIRGLFSFNNILKAPIIFDAISTSVRSDLSRTELYLLLKGFRGMHKDHVKVAYSRTDSLTKKVNSFGLYPRYTPIFAGLDSDLSTILINNDILKEQAGIEVLNGSGLRGLATSRSRWITNSGGRIVHFGNSIESSNKTYIYVTDPESYPSTISELGKIFNEKAIILHEEYKYKHFGDIVVILGTEYE